MQSLLGCFPWLEAPGRHRGGAGPRLRSKTTVQEEPRVKKELDLPEVKKEAEVKKEPEAETEEKVAPTTPAPLRRASTGSSSQLGRTPSTSSARRNQNLVSLFKQQGASLELDPDSGFNRKPAKEEPEAAPRGPQHGGVAPALRASLAKAAQDRRSADEAAALRRETRQRLEAKADEQDRLVAEGGVVALEDQVHGWRGRKGTGGRPPNEEPRTGTAAGLSSNRRALGAPVLRRDPKAYEKLHILGYVERAMESNGVKDPREIPGETKRRLEREWAWPFETLLKWHKIKDKIKRFVIKARVGLHGLRPFGSNLPVTQKGSTSQGARLREETNEPTKQQPLNGVFARLRAWFDKERNEYNKEVREKHVNERLKAELELERDKQTVLKQLERPNFNQTVLTACKEKLEWFQVHDGPEKQKLWLTNTVWPALGCRPRASQHKSDQRVALDEPKTFVTWASADRALYLAAYGGEAELQQYVREPRRWIEGRRQLWCIFLDETPLWLKLRGEEKVLLSSYELLTSAERHKLSHQVKKAKTAEEKECAKQALETWCESHKNDKSKPLTYSFFSQAGDKHRLTLINISAVEAWFDVEKVPQAHKKVVVLLVHAKETCRAEDIDENGNWNKDVVYESDEGTVRHKKGESAGGLLQAWIEARAHVLDDCTKEVKIWGQPAAWVNRRHPENAPNTRIPRKLRVS